MTTERRAHARGKASVDVSFNDATGETTHAGKLYDLGRGGMFVATEDRVPVGKRIEFEVKAPEGVVSGMGRVIWVRDAPTAGTDGGQVPAGMGIKFIDVEDDALLTIDRISGLKKNVRERTVLGMMAPTPATPVVAVGSPSPPPAATTAAPVPAAAPAVAKPAAFTPRPGRERTVLGLGVDLTAKKAEPLPAPREAELSWPDEPPEAPPDEAPPAAAPAAPAAPAADASPLASEAKTIPEQLAPPEPVKAAPDPDPEPVREPAKAAAAPEPAPVVAEAKPQPEPEPGPIVIKPPASSGSLPVPRELPQRKSGGRGWLFLVLVLGIAAVAAAYYFRDEISPPDKTVPSATASAPSAGASSASASESTAPSASAASEPEAGGAAVVEAMDAAAEAEATLPLAGAEGIVDAGHHHEHDAGHHDAAHAHEHEHDAGKKAKPKPSAEDNPY